MNLNVGSGQPRGIYKQPSWINLDSAGADDIGGAGTFVRGSVLDMPADWENKFEVVHCIHMLEHLNRNHRQDVFNALYRVLQPGGMLYLEVPDFQEVVDNLYNSYLLRNQELIHKWKTSIYGKQRYIGDAHHWGYDAETLKSLANQAGFRSAVTWTNAFPEKMISTHYKQEPVILLEALK